MSRIGRQEIEIPAGTDVTVTGSTVSVKGSLGSLERTFRDEVTITIDAGKITFAPKNDTPFSQAMWGTVASHVKNMVDGVNAKFEKKLEIEGVGLRAEVKGTTLAMQLGFSHPVEMEIPSDLDVSVEKNVITVAGIDKDLVGAFASQVKAKKKPEPYKGKGIKYQGELIKRKQGKRSV